MSNQLRLEYSSALFHVKSRGNGNLDIFESRHDYESFLDSLGTCVRRFSWILTAYVLMPNRFRLVIELTNTNLSRGMQWLNGKYGGGFNFRHDRVGHVYQCPFEAVLVEKESYFQQVARDVVLDPVAAGAVARPEEYEWSSHSAVIGSALAPDWLAVNELMGQFASERDRARELYREFVDEAIGRESNLWSHRVGQIYLGGEAWIEEIRERVKLKPRSAAHPRTQRSVGEVPIARVMEAVATTFSTTEDSLRKWGNSIPRMVVAWIGRNEAQLTNRAIAAGLCLRNSGHVSDVIRRCDQKLQSNPFLQAYVDRCIATIRRINR